MTGFDFIKYLSILPEIHSGLLVELFNCRLLVWDDCLETLDLRLLLLWFLIGGTGTGLCPLTPLLVLLVPLLQDGGVMFSTD